MSSKFINKILGGLFLADYTVGLTIMIFIISSWMPLSDYYTGTTLFLFVGKFCLHVAFGLAVVVALFLNHKKAILVSTPLYVAQIFISKFWPTNPNSPKFQNMIQEAQQAMDSGEVVFTDVQATVYPFTFIYVFYVLSLIYVFFVMPKLREKYIKNAPPAV